MATAKRAKKTAKRPTKSAGASKGKGKGKGLEELILQAMTDKKFIAHLESDPEAALAENGYEVSSQLVTAIKSVDFKAFRKVPKKVGVSFC